MPMPFVGVKAQYPSELCRRMALKEEQTPSFEYHSSQRAQRFHLLTDSLEHFRASRVAEMPAIFDLDESELQPFAGDGGHINEIWTRLPSRPDRHPSILEGEVGPEHHRRVR